MKLLRISFIETSLPVELDMVLKVIRQSLVSTVNSMVLLSEHLSTPARVLSISTAAVTGSNAEEYPSANFFKSLASNLFASLQGAILYISHSSESSNLPAAVLLFESLQRIDGLPANLCNDGGKSNQFLLAAFVSSLRLVEEHHIFKLKAIACISISSSNTVHDKVISTTCSKLLDCIEWLVNRESFRVENYTSARRDVSIAFHQVL